MVFYLGIRQKKLDFGEVDEERSSKFYSVKQSDAPSSLPWELCIYTNTFVITYLRNSRHIINGNIMYPKILLDQCLQNTEYV